MRRWYTGPYQEKDGWRCVIRDEEGRRSSCSAPTAEAAIEAAEATIQTLNSTNIEEVITVGAAIDKYEAYMREVKKNRESSVWQTSFRLRKFFKEKLASPILRLTPLWCAERYEAFAAEVSVDYHRNVLAEAKTFLQWCREKPRAWLRLHPLAEVKGVGQRRYGKEQLRPAEGIAWRNQAIALAQDGDDGALAALLLLDGGARSGEVVTRRVRDLVDGARFVLVDTDAELGWSPKKRRSKRPLGPLPEDLRELLLLQARGKLPGAFLFQARGRRGKPAGGPHDVGWVDDQVKRVCREAGVPERCAHSLRGLRTTLDLLEGLTPRQVADRRGHEDERTTLQSYAAPGAAESAQQQRYLEQLGAFRECSGNKKGRVQPA